MGAENGKPVDACPNCGKPGKHFVPPSMGDQGFYVCDEKQELIEVPVKFLDKTSSTVEALCARIAELEAENKRLRDLVGKAFDAGWKNRNEWKQDPSFKKGEFIRANGLGEG